MSCIIQVIIFMWYVVLICVPVNVKYANQQMGVQEGSKKGRSGLEMLLSKAKQKPDLHLILVLPRAGGPVAVRDLHEAHQPAGAPPHLPGCSTGNRLRLLCSLLAKRVRQRVVAVRESPAPHLFSLPVCILKQSRAV